MPLSLDQFAGQLQDSGLFEADEVAALRTASAATTAEQFARALVKQKKLTKFQAQQVYAGKGKSLLLGNYLLQDKIGQGGMGLVYKAVHRRMRRTVALKVLPSSVTKNASLVARFQREAQAAARLEHPNIVSAFDADEAQGASFLVMQYVDGQDLSTLVKTKGPLPVEQAVDCILQAALGLEYAHQQGVIHRDIKPANLLLDADGTVKILDMGLARFEGDATQAELTNTGAVMGTVDYMAPEQALSTKAADARSDIYSLGISLWYLLVGRAAYAGDSLMARMLAHRESPIPSLVATLKTCKSPRLLQAVDDVFQRMVAKSPADRYQTMGEVVEALELCLSGEAPAPRLTPARSAHDSNFNEFLAGLSNSNPTLPSTRGQPAAVVLPGFTEFEPTQSAGSQSAQTDPQTLPAPRPAQPVPAGAPRFRTAPWQDRRVQAALAAGIVLCGLAVVLLLFRGTSREPAPPPEQIVAGAAADSSGAKAASKLAPPDFNAPSNDDDDLPTNTAGMPTFFGSPAASSNKRLKLGFWNDLFNGQDLNGWSHRGHNGWSTEFGVLQGEAGAGETGRLLTDNLYADFQVELEYRLSPGTDSGVFLRAPSEGKSDGSEFLEIQLIDDGAPKFQPLKAKARTGALFGRAAVKAPANAPAETWNRLQIWLVGPQLRVGVNGAVVLEYDEVSRLDAGHIGLQLTPGKVEFRNMRVRIVSEN